MPRHDETRRTAATYGRLWELAARGAVVSGAGHLDRFERSLAIPPTRPGARVLDAGCGIGADVVTFAARDATGLVVGLDLSDAVVVAPRPPNARYVRGSVLAPPFRERSFELVYSYGVVHHTPDPAGAIVALARLLVPGGWLAAYVYSDLRGSPPLRVAVAAIAVARHVTTRLPHPVLLALCRAAAPLVYLAFGLPAAALRRTGRSALAGRLPFNWACSPQAGTGDLYDRFAAPIEHRFARAEVIELCTRAGLRQVSVAPLAGARGWCVIGRRP